jgi:CheY-like chemotaxis protein
LTDILDISRIEAGKMRIIAAEFSMAGLRESILELFRFASTEKGLDLLFDLDASLPPRLIGDEARVRQILFNLVGNAIKFTETGSVHVQAHLLPCGAADRIRILFMVRDTGIGISDGQLAAVFEPFVQAEDSYTRTYQGAGLGLSIVRKLVGLLGGTLAIDNTEGRGTTVYLSLPFGLPAAPSGEARDPERDAPRAGPPGLRVLFAEDDAVSLLSGRTMLEKSGYEVVTATDGQEVLRLFEEQDFDLIVMDIQMPVLDGIEATRRIRAAHPDGPRSAVPIIAMTAYAMTGDREKFLAAGINDYISKPVDMHLFHEVVARVLARGRASLPAAPDAPR